MPRTRPRAAVPIVLVVLSLVLVAESLLMLGLYVHNHRRLQAAEATAAALQGENDALQSALRRAEEETRAARAERDAARQQACEAARLRDEATQAVQQLQKDLLDVAAYPAGTVLQAAQLNLEKPQNYFRAYPIVPGDAVYARIYGKSYVDNPHIALGELRYLKVLHYNFDHQIQVGELIVNAQLEADFLAIFRELFLAEYEIQSMHLIDNYWTGEGGSSDSASIEENNTSAFCYRRVTGGSSLSNHAFGRAIDINPQQNPYVTYRNGKPAWSHDNADPYIDRSGDGAHMITHEDVCFQIFQKYGFTWGGDWTNPKDYQHFQKE